jgi:hypothetical protein
MGFLKKREMKRDRPAQKKLGKENEKLWLFRITLAIPIPLKRKEKKSYSHGRTRTLQKKLSLQVPHKTYFLGYCCFSNL